MAPADDQPVATQESPRDAQSGPADERTPLLGQEAAEPSSETAAASRVSLSENIKRWRRQRWISLLIAFVLVTAIVVLTLVFGVFGSRRRMGSSGNALCLTAPCIHAASDILYNLSPDYKNIDPCTNFEEFVCDGWRSRHDMRPDQGSLDSFNQIQDNNQMILRHILESPYPGASDHSSYSPMRLTLRASTADEDNFNEMQRAYNACMAVDKIKKVGVKPIQDLVGNLTEILAFEGSPSITQADSKAISAATVFLERLGISSIFSFGDGADDKNPDTVVVFAGPRSRIGLPSPAYYLDEDTVKDYTSAMTQVLKGVLPSTKGSVDKLAAAVVDFESKIAAATPPLEDLQDVTKAYNAMSLKDTSALVPILDIEHILTSLVPSNYTLDRMITQFPEFFVNVSTILETTSKDTLQGFLTWKVIQATATLVDAPEVKPYIQFSNKLAGKDADATTERYRTCISHVDGGLGWILGRFYIEQAFSADAKKLGDQIVSDIKEQFKNKLSSLDWMEDEVKKLAAEKVDALVQKIGYPTQSPNVTDPASLRDYYTGLNISDAYFDNSMSVSRWSVNQSWSALGKPVDRNEWGMTPPTVNAYYNPAGNEIVFPAGIMQYPAFGGELPQYMNYGAFGAVAGHELSHAFDNNGKNYDPSGNLTDVPWWTNKTLRAFETRAECFVNEYSNFTASGVNGTTLHVNGRQTLGENIADAGGLSASFSAWQQRRQDYPDLDLPGLDDFSQEQLFYISFGNFWCSKYTLNALTSRIRTDEHSPDWARIMGPAMMNSRGFREAFSCPAKEPVCELW